MTDRPIIFSADMVRALLDGRKTQTRRVLKPQPYDTGECRAIHIGGRTWRLGVLAHAAVGDDWTIPYAPGDRLWVREAWGHDAPTLAKCRARYEDAMSGVPGFGPYYMADGGWAENHTITKRPSIHMPRWASRLTLVVTDVRVQRVQEISGMDAKREGVSIPAHLPGDGADLDHAKRAFRDLWNRLNAKRGFGWEVNPWVCAISFRCIPKNIDSLTGAE